MFDSSFNKSQFLTDGSSSSDSESDFDLSDSETDSRFFGDNPLPANIFACLSSMCLRVIDEDGADVGSGEDGASKTYNAGSKDDSGSSERESEGESDTGSGSIIDATRGCGRGRGSGRGRGRGRGEVVERGEVVDRHLKRILVERNCLFTSCL